MIKDIIYCIKVSLKASKIYTILHFVTEILNSLFPVIISLTTKSIIDSLILKKVNVSALIVLFLAYIFQSASKQLNQYVYSLQSDTIERYLQWEMQEISSNMQMIYYDDHKYYDSFEYVKNNLYIIWTGIVNSITIVSYGILLLYTIFLVLPYLKWVTAILIVVSIPAAISEYYFTEKLYAWRLSHIEEERKMDYFYDLCTRKKYAADIRLYNLADKIINKTKIIWNVFINKKKSVIKKRIIINYILEIVEILVSMYALYNVFALVLSDKYTIGDFTLFVGLLDQLRNSLQNGIGNLMDIYDKKLKIEYYIKFKNSIMSEHKNGNKKINVIDRIDYVNVSFKYPNTECYTLKDISFTIQRGQKVCIVGENGAGKSTIIKLLLGFYEVSQGDILINGLSIKSYDINELRNKMGCFFQNGDTFAFDIEDNITVMNDDVDKCLFYKSIDQVDAGNFIAKLPHKEKTFISREFAEDGIVLSGGQNQKILLARVFYRNADVWLLDEPSASLDPKSEKILFESLDKKRDKILLFVSHRLSNVLSADSIIVLNEGKIENAGTHDYLLKNCRSYKKLFECQANKYMRL